MGDSLKEKYHGKHLSTDDSAVAQNEVSNAIEELESISIKHGPDYLLLKWGTLESWGYEQNPDGIKILEEYGSLGSSMSAMAWHDTDKQKELICKLIDVTNGVIQSDWSGEYFTKEAAKEYIMGSKS